MPVRTLDLVVAATRSETEASAIVENGLLEAVTATIISGNARRGDLYVSLGIYTGGTGFTQRSVILTSGYVGSGFTIGWTGQLRLETAERIFILAWSNVVATLRLNVRVHRG